MAHQQVNLASTYSTIGNSDPEMDAVFKAFLAYWHGYIKAIETGQFDDLTAVADGQALQDAKDTVTRDSALHQMRRLEVIQQLPPVIALGSDGVSAQVGENTTTHEQIVDGQGHVTSDVQRTNFLLRTMQLKDGAWKVAGLQARV